MTCNNSNSNINKTFILEPLSITGASTTLTASTALYTNQVKSYSGNTTITMGTNIISFNHDISIEGNVTAEIYYGDGSQLSGVAKHDYYTTAVTLDDTILYFNRNDQLSAYTLDLSSFTLNNEFIGHTGNTSIHYPMSSITLSKLGSSAHTHTINDITDLTANFIAKTGGTITGSLTINSNLTVNGDFSLKTNTITAITDTILSASTNYEIPTTKAVYDYITNNNFNKITVTFDGCYTYIPTNTMAKTMADGNYNIIAWKIVGNNQTNSGCTASIDVLINGVSAVGSGNKPSLTNATANYATISGWTTTVINENDIIGLNIASNNDATYLNVVIELGLIA